MWAEVKQRGIEAWKLNVGLEKYLFSLIWSDYIANIWDLWLTLKVITFSILFCDKNKKIKGDRGIEKGRNTTFYLLQKKVSVGKD